MSICGNCGIEADRIKYFYTVNGRIENCPQCTNKHIPLSLFSRDNIHVQGAFGGKGKRTAAHNDDISRRRLAPDGSVYRDRGRRTFQI